MRWLVVVACIAGCGATHAEPRRSAPPASVTGLPDEDAPAVCTALEACCVEDPMSRACAEWPDSVAEIGVSRHSCTVAGGAWRDEPRAAGTSPPPGCGPLLVAMETERRAPLAEDEIACGADEECIVVAAGRDEWCNVGGPVVAATRTAATEVQARLDTIPLELAPTMPLLCPMALPRCVARACELEWDWGRCEHDADCVRLEQGDVANACRASSAERLARALAEDGVDGPPRVSSERARCVEGRCTLEGASD